MTRKWNYPRLTTEEQKLGEELARRFANCPPISDLLVQRGITTIESAEKFFHPSLRDLHDPSLLSTDTSRISIPNWTSTSPRATRKATEYRVP